MNAVPRWLTPALALWTLVFAAALANATAIHLTAGPVVLVLGLLALAHGLIHQRWLAAGPLAVVAFAAALVAKISPGWLGDSFTGPAGDVGVRTIWVAAVLVLSAVIAWCLEVHRRLRHSLAGLSGFRPGARVAGQAASIRRSLSTLAHDLDRVEKHLTTVR